MWYFFPSEGGKLIPWCPEVVLYIIQPGQVSPRAQVSFHWLCCGIVDCRDLSWVTAHTIIGDEVVQVVLRLVCGTSVT